MEYDGSIRIGVSVLLKEAEKKLENLKSKLVNQTKEIDKQAATVQKLRAQYDKLMEGKEPRGVKTLEDSLKRANAEAEKLDQKFQEISQLAELDKAVRGYVSPDLAIKLEEARSELTAANLKADQLSNKLQNLKAPPESSEEAKKLAAAITEAESALQGLKDGAADTASEIDKAQSEVDELSAKLQALKDNAAVADQSIIDLRNELEELNKRKADFEAAGVGLGYEEYDSILTRIKEINDELKNYQSNLENVNNTQSWADKLREAVSRMGAVIKEKMASSVSAIGALRKKISGLGREKGFDKAGNAATRLLNRLKKLVAGAFFFRIIGRQLRALVSQIGKYLTANRDFSNALSGLKSNLLTAFQPVYEAVIPALTAMMEAMEAAAAKFASFMASVFGTTASKAQENAQALYEQANATEETGEAAKKAQKDQEKYLASFDTIEKLGSVKKEEEKKPTAPAFDTDFSEVQPPQWLQDFWAPIKESWDQVGTDTIQAAKNALGSIWDLLKTIGRSFLDLWNSPAGLEVLTKVHILLQTILGIIHDIAAAFITAWNSGTGEQVIQALFFMLSSVLDLLISIGQSFREAWNDNGRGVEICNTILEIIRNIFNIVGNLAESFREAWEANGNGVAIWGAILDIIKNILHFIENITLSTAEWAKSLNLEPLVSGIRVALENLVPLIFTIADTVADFWKNTVLPLLKWLIEDGIPTVLQLLAKLFSYLAQNPQVIANLTKLVIGFIAAWEVASVINAIAKLLTHFRLLGSAIVAMSGLAKSAIVGLIGLMQGPLLTAIKAAIIAINAHPVIAAITAIAAVLGLVIANWDALKQKAKEVLDWIIDHIKMAIKSVQDLFSALGGGKAKASSGYGAKIGGGSTYSARTFSTYDLSGIDSIPDIPRLAKGAVISPNSEFLAILGDQRNGKNIEAPAPLFEDMLNRAVNSANSGGETVVTVNFTGTLSQLVRLLQPQIQIEQRRLGSNLLGG